MMAPGGSALPALSVWFPVGRGRRTRRDHASIRIVTRYALALLVALGFTARAAAEPKPWRAGNLQTVEVWTQATQKQQAGNTNVWIARGLHADRSARTVEFVVEATGLTTDALTEFLVVSTSSEKDYESLAVSLAHAGDICRGLEFVGMPRGRPVKPAICQFWPKGERVRATFRPFGRSAKDARPLSACLQDKRPRTLLPENFVYVGSCWTGAVCLADEASPGAFISTYNEPTVVLDVPSRAPQSDVYGNLVLSPAGTFERGALLTITLTPEPLSNGVPRVVDLTFEARRRADGAGGNGLEALECITRGTEPALGPVTNDVKGALERLAELSRNGRDPFMTVSWDDAISLGAARELARVFTMVEGESGVRVEAPLAGQLYYKAFLPGERWRARADRPSQPWELRVTRSKEKKGGWSCTLVQILEDWSKEGQFTPDLTPTDFQLARPEDLPGKIRELVAAQVLEVTQKLAREGKPTDDSRVGQLATLKRINTLFIFAPPDAPLGSFMPAVRLMHDTLPQVHVFVE
ncbi:MAG: hypothetical protein ACOYOU_03425 [Kiritimatiellia bacterium]